MAVQWDDDDRPTGRELKDAGAPPPADEDRPEGEEPASPRPRLR